MTDPIRPVVRALEVLRALNHQPQMSLRELQRATGLPKPTVHRLLATLKSEGYVRSDVVTGDYALTAKVRHLSEGFTEHELVVEVGAPVLLQATRQTGLPLALGVLERGRIAVRYSSMPYSPFGPVRTTSGHTHDLLQSGMGQAWLAFCPEQEQEWLIRLLLSGTEPAQSCALHSTIETVIAETRKRGFGLRLPAGVNKTATMAVPVTHAASMLAVLSLTTFAGLLSARTTRECLSLLNRVRRQVGEQVAAKELGAGLTVPCHETEIGNP